MQTALIFWKGGCQIIVLPPGISMLATEAHIERIEDGIVLRPIAGSEAGVRETPRPDPPRLVASDGRTVAGFQSFADRVGRAVEIMKMFGQLPANDNEPLEERSGPLFAA